MVRVDVDISLKPTKCPFNKEGHHVNCIGCNRFIDFQGKIENGVAKYYTICDYNILSSATGPVQSRAIKFRAWCLWDYPHYVYNIQSSYDNGCKTFRDAVSPLDNEECFGDYLNDSFTKGENYIVEQFTGLIDIKGKDIYEGDVVKVPVEIGFYTTEVIFKSGMFTLLDNRTSKPDGRCLDTVEVLGNIHVPLDKE